MRPSSLALLLAAAALFTAPQQALAATPPAPASVQAAIDSCLGAVAPSAERTIGDADTIIENALTDAKCDVAPVYADSDSTLTPALYRARTDASIVYAKDVLTLLTAEQTKFCTGAPSPRCTALGVIEARARALAKNLDDVKAFRYSTKTPLENTYQLGPEGYATSPPLDFFALAKSKAPAGAREEQACSACVDDAISLVPAVVYARAMFAAYGVFSSAGLEKFLADRERDGARWEAYHFGAGYARVQLPQELLANCLVFHYADNCFNPTDTPARGFTKPPEGAITLLHPSVGVNLKTSDGADSSIVGVVEVLGYSHWGYTEENTRGKEFGASLIAAYQPSDEAEDWGYGVLVRTPWKNLNVAWVRTERDNGDDEDSFLLSVDISQIFNVGQRGFCRQGIGVCDGPAGERRQ